MDVETLVIIYFMFFSHALSIVLNQRKVDAIDNIGNESNTFFGNYVIVILFDPKSYAILITVWHVYWSDGIGI